MRISSVAEASEDEAVSWVAARWPIVTAAATIRGQFTFMSMAFGLVSARGFLGIAFGHAAATLEFG